MEYGKVKKASCQIGSWPAKAAKMALKLWFLSADNHIMGQTRLLTRNKHMIQWLGVAIALVGFIWNGVKDYQQGEIKIPPLTQQKQLTKVIYPIQYCLMAYDPNLDKVFYLHDNGQWFDYAPPQRRYPPTTQPQ